jgi:hypothetical protein
MKPVVMASRHLAIATPSHPDVVKLIQTALVDAFELRIAAHIEENSFALLE